MDGDRDGDSDSSSSSALGALGFMFDAANATSLKAYSFSPPSGPLTLHLNVIDDTPGACISGHYLWPAASLLCAHLCSASPPLPPAPARALELGAGCGLAGILAGCLLPAGSTLAFTDHDPGVLETCEGNVRATLERLPTPHPGPLVEAGYFDLPWGDAGAAGPVLEGGQFELVLGSDVIYSKDIVRPLFETIGKLLKPGGRMVMSQSFEYDGETEKEIDRMCKQVGVEREVVLDTFASGDESDENKGKIQYFSKPT